MDQSTKDNPYAPPASEVATPVQSPTGTAFVRMGLVAGVSGLVLGVIDIHIGDHSFEAIRLLAYLLIAVLLGWFYGLRALWAVVLLGSSLWPIHAAAFACGVRRPFVERDMESTAFTLFLNVPCCMAFAFGLFVRHLIRLSKTQ